MKRKLLYGMIGGGILGISAVLSLWRPGSQAPSQRATTLELDNGQRDTVTLSPAQVVQARIKTVTTTERTLQPTRTVPGRLAYDQDRHVAVKAAFDGVITDFLVRPGDKVSAGQTLAIVSSPEVGATRAEIKRRETVLQLARRQTDWRARVQDGVTLLVKLIRNETEPQEIEAALQYQALGEFRERLISAYIRARLANAMADNIREAAKSGAVAGKVRQERESERQAAQAALQSEIEQSLFEIEQSCRESAAKSDDALRQLDVSLQTLKSLLGPSSAASDAEASTNSQAASLSEVHIVAPIDGAIEERTLAATERVAAGEPIAVIADTRHLWAVADIREQDWATISVDVGQEVIITTPALPDESYVGEVLIVGRTVDAATGAASLIARLQAQDSRLRPGLFVRMTIPSGPSRTALFVPESAVVVHDGQAFVFVSEGATQFRRLDVQCGSQQDDQVEIVSGLASGAQVVSEGAALLKSALLMVGGSE